MAKKRKKSRPKHKVGRRAFLTAAGSGAAAAVILKVPPYVQGRTFNPALIRPPGSLAENDFLQKCVRCGECMKVCPTNAIHPTTLEAGLAGIWSPMLIMSVGYCEFNCTLCGQVCPTGAIEELTLEEKQERLIGTAHVSRQSAQLVHETIHDEQPDTVCVELCQTRLNSMKDKDRWRNMDIVKVIKEKKALLLFINLLLASFQKKMADKFGIRPGQEMINAVDAAEKVAAVVRD